VSVHGGSAEVEDLGSRNGTVVQPPDGGQVDLQPGVPVLLPDGAIVTMAEVSFEYRALAARPD
jgi:pSer/pThr/pTyr-binding forkhead associated (FHA) protein